MSIKGTSPHDPQEWNADKQETVRCQDSIECQKRTMLRARSFIGVLQQSIIELAGKLELEKQEFLQKDAALRERINSSSFRMDQLEELNNHLAQQNNNTTTVIQQLINQKRQMAQSGVDWYNEANAQFIVMEYNIEYQKFAKREMAGLDKRIQAGKSLDWTASAMQLEAEKLLSEVYMIGLMVIARRKQYDEWQTRCVQQATSILEQAAEFRNHGVLYGYPIGQDVDFWTGNSLSGIESDVQGILDVIKTRINDPSFQVSDLQDLMSRLIRLEQEKNQVVDCALENARRSEMVQAEVRLAVRVLGNHDFRLVGANYEMGDERRPFIARLRRDTDDMEVELICGYDSENNQYKLAHRMNSKAYADENVKKALEEDIAQSLIEAGVMLLSNTSCDAVDLPPFDGGKWEVDEGLRSEMNVSPLRFVRQ